jgi:arylsulfatase A-like enzyme
MYRDESNPPCTIHGSPWRYGTYVPILFAGAGIPAQWIRRLVHPVDIAATLAALLGKKPSSGATGESLKKS